MPLKTLVQLCPLLTLPSSPLFEEYSSPGMSGYMVLGGFRFDLALNHKNEATVSQDSVGSEDIEEVWEVGHCDPKVGAWLNLELILHQSPTPGAETQN